MNNISETISRNRPGKQYILLTGATGLVGRYLLKDLLTRGCRLAVIVRAGKRLSAEERVEAIQQFWEQELGHSMPRPVVLEGDVTKENLGLDEIETAWIREHVNHVIHNAAVLKFTGDDQSRDPWRTNLGGTRNVLQFCRENAIENLSYVSTAYVSGIRDDVVSESDFDTAQEFRNDYERSKFAAEKIVREADFFKSVTIFRPAVIVGDSETGYTSTYHGLFLYLRLCDLLVSQQQPNEDGIIETPLSLPMSGDEPRNLVSVDWVSEVISHIVCSPAAHGRTYHLTPDECTTPRQIIDACYSYFNSAGVQYLGAGSDRIADNDFAATFFENARIYEAYENSDPQFDRSNVREFAGHLPCPKIDADMIIRFLEFGKSDNWGKRSDRRPAVNLWFKSHLDQLARGMTRLIEVHGPRADDDALLIGLDIQGPGGGQWHVTADQDVCEVNRGLPNKPHGLLQMDNHQVAELLNGSALTPERCEGVWKTTLEQFFDVADKSTVK